MDAGQHFIVTKRRREGGVSPLLCTAPQQREQTVRAWYVGISTPTRVPGTLVSEHGAISSNVLVQCP